MPTRDELFDDDEPTLGADPESEPPAKPFVQYLRETPPAPLSEGTKYALWGAGVLTVILFLASMLKIAN